MRGEESDDENEMVAMIEEDGPTAVMIQPYGVVLDEKKFGKPIDRDVERFGQIRGFKLLTDVVT